MTTNPRPQTGENAVASDEAAMMQRWGQITQAPVLKAVSSGEVSVRLAPEPPEP